METLRCRCPRCGITIDVRVADKDDKPPQKIIDLALESTDGGVKTYGKPEMLPKPENKGDNK